jgi:hypothetical protein
VSFGLRVFVCDNMAFAGMAFAGDQVIKHKHTANLKRDLPGLIGEIIEPLAIQREAQKKQIDRYQRTEIADEWADMVIMQMCRQGVINVQRIPK